MNLQSFTDAFTLIKVCYLGLGLKEFCLAVNMVNNEFHGKKYIQSLIQ